MKYNFFLLPVLLGFLFFTPACEFLNRPPDREISLEERLRRAAEQGQPPAGMSPYSQPGTQPAPAGAYPGPQPGAYGPAPQHYPPGSHQTNPYQNGQNPHQTGSTSCNTADDCVLVSVDCCSCNNGGDATAVHKSQKYAHNNALLTRCRNSAEQRMCLREYRRCSNYRVQCQNSQCVAVEQ